jgi:hypothetical protein
VFAVRVVVMTVLCVGGGGRRRGSPFGCGGEVGSVALHLVVFGAPACTSCTTRGIAHQMATLSGRRAASLLQTRSGGRDEGDLFRVFSE